MIQFITQENELKEDQQMMIIDTKNDDQGRMKQEAIKLRGQEKKKTQRHQRAEKEDPKKN